MDEAEFRVIYCLADMYLREGDIQQAEPVLNRMAKLLQKMNYCVENLRYLYLYQDKKALYEINCLAYEQAVATMDDAIRCMEDLRDGLMKEPLVQQFFRSRTEAPSEWIGNAYCMKIYAEMFLQRTQPELYEQGLRQDSEIALSQYSFRGGLERNQQYRAHIEMEHGDYPAAMQWLLDTQEIRDGRNHWLESCIRYLDLAMDEDHLSKCYYLMYYLEIMLEARQHGQEDFAAVLHQALKTQRKLMEELLLEHALDTEIKSDQVNAEVHIYRDFLQTTLRNRPASYHPEEMLYWKYGIYLMECGLEDEGLHYLDRALKVCGEHTEFTALQMAALAIRMERFSRLMEAKALSVEGMKTELFARHLTEQKLPQKMQEYAEMCMKLLNRGIKEETPWKDLRDEAYMLSRKIAF